MSTQRKQIVLAPAQQEDDADIRALLREAPMAGDIRLSLQREPHNWLAAAVEGEPHYTFVARDSSNGSFIGFGSRGVKQVWINGRQERIGYLSQLRSSASYTVRRRPMAEAFEVTRKTRRPDELPFDFTTIMSDNLRARRFLERGIKGFPSYRPLGELTTLTLTVRRGKRVAPPGVDIRKGTKELLPHIVACLQRNMQRYQLGPVWTEASLIHDEKTPGLRIEDFFLAYVKGKPVGCLALWDQRTFKQTVISGYSKRLGLLRPLLNMGMVLTAGPRLPAPGQSLPFAYLSHVGIDEDNPLVLRALIAAACSHPLASRLDFLVLGLAEGNPMLPDLERRLRPRILRSVLYLVEYGAAEEALNLMDGRVFHAEVATL